MNTDPNIPDPDGFYAAILAASEDLSDAEGLAFALRLSLLLANQIGDQAVLLDAVHAARPRRGAAQ
ncbi:DUF2783 domain-containing protein [Roseomonas sp. BN140053]|uniref:DUF2783 domain-containing protein n=1 Tax=Roseomonas sp. BN140053 TaxID=3391898 RepID=UPI0039EA18EC